MTIGRSHLERAVFTSADLRKADFESVQLQGASLDHRAASGRVARPSRGFRARRFAPVAPCAWLPSSSPTTIAADGVRGRIDIEPDDGLD